VVSVVDETRASLDAASHLTAMDKGSVAMLLALAAAADYLLENDGLSPAGKFDNVTIPTYLRYARELGLTPAGRKDLELKKQEAPSGKLAQLRAVKGRTA
jgi:hypothetical protein